MKKSVSKKMFALSVLMSAGILLTGCSGTAAESSESTLMESGAEVVLPKEQVYSVYALTK